MKFLERFEIDDSTMIPTPQEHAVSSFTTTVDPLSNI